MNKFFMWIITFVAGFCCSIYAALVASFLWLWFVTPAFGIVAPSLWILVGLSILIRLITHQIPPMRVDEPEVFTNMIYTVVYFLLYSTSAFISGWVFHHFV